VFSVTSEAAASLPFQAAPPRSAKPDPSQGNDSFQALIDGSAPADTGNDRANAMAQQQSASHRRADDAPAAADTKRSRDAGSADQAARNNSGDRDATARQRSDGDADTEANTDAVQQSDAKPNTLKAGTAKPIERKSTDLKVPSETAFAPDFSSAPDSSTVAAASAQQDATSVTTPNPVAVAIAVTIVSTDTALATPASGNATAPLAIAAAAIAASSPASAAPAASPVQIENDSDAVAAVTTPAAAGVTVSAAASASAETPTISTDGAANAEVLVQAAASKAVAAPVQQQAAQSVATAATAATDLALTAAVAATAPVEAKTTLLKAPVAAPAKTAPSSAANTTSGAPDPSATATAADAPRNNVAPPPAPAARQDGGNGRVEAAKADALASSSPASPAAEPAHEHSPVNATAHTPTGSSDPGVQATGTVQPQPASAPATTAPAGSLTVTAATNAVVPLSGLALEIAVSARSGKSRFEIRLDPADLGRIDVRIDVDRNGHVTSHLTVEKPETLSMLRQDAPQLQRQLDDAGFKTGNGGLQFSLRDQSSSGQNNDNETGRNAQRLVISDEDAIPAVAAGRTYGRVLGSSSGVDIRV
jgi:flagellar hook-length control protein FliK